MSAETGMGKIMDEREQYVRSAMRALEKERAGLKDLQEALSGPLGAAFGDVVKLILELQGRVIMTGMGKSGHIARKISTGTPAYFVHPAEASHGDLGMVTREDVVIMISNSGETPELAEMIKYTRKYRIPLVGMTARAESSLARAAGRVLLLPASPEACINGLAPTTSTTMQLALGDALAVALLEARKFTAKQFGDYHPGGKLGALLKCVGEIMHGESELPLAHEDEIMSDVLLTMTGRHFGCVGVVDEAGRLEGIITDGDLRRAMEETPDLLKLRARDVMTKNPKTMPPDELTSAALGFMNKKKITVIFIVEDGKPAGLVHIHDLLRLEKPEN